PQPGHRPDYPSRPPGAPGPPGPPGPPGGGPGGPGADARPANSPGSTTRSSLVRSGAGMAVGTLVSRATGFLRTLVLVYAMGTLALGNAYNNANTLPNTVYYLMLGGIFTSVVVPLLVRAGRRDPDRGEAYTQRLFTLGALSLLGVTVVATLLAAPLVDLYAPTIHGPAGSPLAAEHNLMVLWAYFFIPQIFFYGMSSLIGAILNTRGRFAAPMWAPVVNNLVVIVIGGLYVMTVGLNKDPSNISAGGVQLLGIGTTLGVVAQTVALFPSLRAAGFRWRPTLGFRPGEVTEMGRMAGWMSVYVIATWAGSLVVQIIANAASAGKNGYSAYSIAWQLFQLPYAIIGISVITALLPRMSEHASARRYSLVRDDFSIGVRLASVLVVPAAIYLAVLGGPLAEFLFSYGSNTPAEARYIGEVFGLFALGLVPYMLTQLQLRVFYSFQDSRTAAFVGLLMMCVSIAGALIALHVLPAADVVAGLAVAYGIANLVGTIAGWALLLRRVGSLDGWAIARSLTRMHLATVPGLIFALAVMIGVGHVVHNPSAAYGLVVVIVGGGGAVALYALCARSLHVAEFGFLTKTIAARFGRQSRRH
ncbi:MAG: murein biosynthesis integral membrane protein MurJ, partial [Streptosporangiaceae bacterium]